MFIGLKANVSEALVVETIGSLIGLDGIGEYMDQKHHLFEVKFEKNFTSPKCAKEVSGTGSEGSPRFQLEYITPTEMMMLETGSMVAEPDSNAVSLHCGPQKS